MQIYTHVQQNSYIIALKGNLNLEDAPTVQDAMLKALQYNPKEVMVDCEGLEEISPRSLRTFISTIRDLQRNQVRLVLISVKGQLRSIFTCLGADSFMNSVPSSSIVGSNNEYDIYFRQI